MEDEPYRHGHRHQLAHEVRQLLPIRNLFSLSTQKAIGIGICVVPMAAALGPDPTLPSAPAVSRLITAAFGHCRTSSSCSHNEHMRPLRKCRDRT